MAELDDIADQKLSDTELTVKELVALIEQAITRRLRIAQSGLPDATEREMSDWWQAMVTELIVPGPDTPSATDMLREERDQWYEPS